MVGDPRFVEIAERNMQGVVPLYYNMRKAEPEQITNESLYNGLIKAFTGGSIGPYSNNISKIWNSEVFISGTVEEKNRAMDIVKLLCMENNFQIDYAKTLYKPKRPEVIDEEIKQFTRHKLPHFFSYAKEKETEQVEKVNGSLVNKLQTIIPNKRMSYRKLPIGKIDYRLLMHDPYIKLDQRVIDKYRKLNREYHFKINMEDEYTNNLHYIASDIKYQLAEFYEDGYDEDDICDMIVAELYGKDSPYKEALWFCYGERILTNLKINISPSGKKLVQCIDCGEWFEVSIKNYRTVRCDNCQKILSNQKARERMAKKRQK